MCVCLLGEGRIGFPKGREKISYLQNKYTILFLISMYRFCVLSCNCWLRGRKIFFYFKNRYWNLLLFSNFFSICNNFIFFFWGKKLKRTHFFFLFHNRCNNSSAVVHHAKGVFCGSLQYIFFFERSERREEGGSIIERFFLEMAASKIQFKSIFLAVPSFFLCCFSLQWWFSE